MNSPNDGGSQTNNTDDDDKVVEVSSPPPATNDAEAAAPTEKAEKTSTSDNNKKQPSLACSRDELIELVKAIKFANTEYSQRQVHREITEVLSQRESFEFLKDVPLNEVKKVWKKAIIMQHQQQQETIPTTTTTTTANSGQEKAKAAKNVDKNSNPNSDLIDKIKQQGGTPQVYTVGDGSVKFLAQEYTASVMAAAAVKEQTKRDEMLQNYVHFFLNVPADKSGSRPHQALINFSNNKPATTTTSSSNKSKKSKGGGSGKKGSKTSSTSSSSTSSSTTKDSGGNGTEDMMMMIVKVQMAAPLHENDVTKYPMLVYNKDHTARTFIHPDEDNDNDQEEDESSSKGYDKIRDWILKDGIGGALGTKGGTKAYFYSRVSTPTTTTTKNKNTESILSILITKLAPPQDW